MQHLSKETLEMLSLCNRTKLVILKSIFKCSGNTCNCSLVDKLNLPKNLVSYHIKTLINKKILTPVKCGKNIKYQIVESKSDMVINLLKALKVN